MDHERSCEVLFWVCRYGKYANVTKANIDKQVSDWMVLKPRHTYTNDYIDKKYKEINADIWSEGRSFIKVVHMSDLHVDLTYAVNSNT